MQHARIREESILLNLAAACAAQCQHVNVCTQVQDRLRQAKDIVPNVRAAQDVLYVTYVAATAAAGVVIVAARLKRVASDHDILTVTHQQSAAMAGQAIVDNATGRRSRYKGDINRALWAGRIDFVKLDAIADRLKPAAAGPYRTVNLGIEKSAVGIELRIVQNVEGVAAASGSDQSSVVDLRVLDLRIIRGTDHKGVASTIY